MYIVIAILIFGLLIAVHELGHFTAAKALGVRVMEFAIGMGPAVFKRQRGETLYALRALPIGGYCAMDEDEESDDPRGFTNQPVWKRFVILAAGSFMNFVLGLILILIVFSQVKGFTPPTITSFSEGCPYEGAEGFMAGDTIYKINGHRIYFSSNVRTYLSRAGETMDIVLVRDGEKVYLDDYALVPVEYEQDGQTVWQYGFNFRGMETGAWAKLKYSWYTAIDYVRLVWISLQDLFSGAYGLRDLSGMVGIVDLINDTGAQAASFADAMFDIGNLAAFIAINLAVMNLLPIPALDGGRILFLFVGAVFRLIFRRKFNPRYEGYVHAAGLVLLLALMAVVMVSDIMKIFNV